MSLDALQNSQFSQLITGGLGLPSLHWAIKGILRTEMGDPRQQRAMRRGRQHPNSGPRHTGVWATGPQFGGFWQQEGLSAIQLKQG